MPSGQTHDRITIWALPLVALLSFWQTSSGNLTLLIAGGFMFGGLMFGPDLDIHSCQYKRWGWFRFIWLPYQKSLRHRSFLSHGPVIGTLLRVIYLCGVGGIVAIALLLIAQLLNLGWSWQVVGEDILEMLSMYSTESLALLLGLELGAMSHSLSDWSNSAYKRFRKQGISSLLPRGKIKKPKPSIRNRRSQPKSK